VVVALVFAFSGAPHLPAVAGSFLERGSLLLSSRRHSEGFRQSLSEPPRNLLLSFVFVLSVPCRLNKWNAHLAVHVPLNGTRKLKTTVSGFIAFQPPMTGFPAGSTQVIAGAIVLRPWTNLTDVRDVKETDGGPGLRARVAG
jgi:hypothetical protein